MTTTIHSLCLLCHKLRILYQNFPEVFGASCKFWYPSSPHQILLLLFYPPDALLFQVLWPTLPNNRAQTGQRLWAKHGQPFVDLLRPRVSLE